MYSHFRRLSLTEMLGLDEINCGRIFGDDSESWSEMPTKSAVPRDAALYVDTCETDESDMDLLAVCPGLGSGRLTRAAMHQIVWTYAEVSGEDRYRLTRPSVWEDCGALVFFSRPHHPRNDRGWVNVAGHPTTAPMVELSWFTFVRSLWMHSHKATLGAPGGKRVASPSYHRLFLPLMAHVRGWVRPDPQQRDFYLAAAQRWALRTLATGLEAATAAEAAQQDARRPALGMRPGFA